MGLTGNQHLLGASKNINGQQGKTGWCIQQNVIIGIRYGFNSLFQTIFPTGFIHQLHIGTAIGKLEAPLEEVLALQKAITSRKIKGGRQILAQGWGTIKPVFPVTSGGLHPGLIPEIINILGKNTIIQVGGGVWGHPQGGRAGAAAVRQAVNAALKGISLDEYAKTKKELRGALEKWGYVKPK